ncbi:hypothetical protein BaRGS_00027899 [Batillaria attramentaria]|uniref:Serine-threonine/tyrosine-protein kinase catalytic domain-containing protein n=1 Tax=Batillaria attramentaria TaxID=370345 RepID=A0ABD0K221_9CAEN
MTNPQVVKHVRSGRHMDKPTGGLECPDAFYAIMCKCWEWDPEKRPPFSQLFDALETYFVSTEAEPESFVQSDSSPQKEAEMQRRPGYERRSGQPLPLPRHLLRFYRMEAIPRGICLIVNNRDFYKDPRNTTAVMLTRRQGTDVDRGYDCRDTESDAVEEEEVQKIPDESDFLLGYSTIPGFVSYRNRQTGSYYIRKLTETLDECAEDHDIHEILTMVNYSVGKDDISTVRGTRKQTPAPMYTLRKKLIFKRSQ